MALTVIHTLSVAVALLAYSVLTVFCLVTLLRHITGRALLLASSASLALVAATGFYNYPPMVQSLKFLVIGAWVLLLSRALGIRKEVLKEARPFAVVLVLTVVLTVFGASYSFVLSPDDLLQPSDAAVPGYIAMVLLNILGLVVIEQLARNTRDDLRWRIRYLNIGLGLFFAYGLFHHAVGVLFKVLLPPLVALEPAILALIVPFVIIASLRNSANQLRLNISRNFVFQTGVLVATGTFLLLMGIAGYYAQVFGGDWGTAVAAFVATVAIAGVAVLVGSSNLRRRLRVSLVKNLFEYRYDYREEWIRVTSKLTEPNADFDLGQQALRGHMDIVHASSGGAWRLDNGTLVPIAQLNAAWNMPLPPPFNREAIEFFGERNWILDRNDWPAEAEALGQELTAIEFLRDSQYLVPLFVESRLFGLIALGPPSFPSVLNWEDYDIIKLIARESAGFLALQHTSTELVENKQLTAMHQMSAFLVHDLKTISAQLSLLVENAKRHKDNPAFVDDMVQTTHNSVSRMNKLLVQLKGGAPEPAENGPFDVDAAIRQTLTTFQYQQPSPSYTHHNGAIFADGNADQFRSALGHLIQNAMDATENHGTVAVTAQETPSWMEVTVTDSGQGMDREFLNEKLFAPFESSKGLSGMGVGAYQARESIRRFGGDVSATSTLGQGSTFVIRLPKEGK